MKTIFAMVHLGISSAQKSIKKMTMHTVVEMRMNRDAAPTQISRRPKTVKNEIDTVYL